MRTRSAALTASLAASAVLAGGLALTLPATAAADDVLHVSTNGGSSVTTRTLTNAVPGQDQGTTTRPGTLLAAAADGSGHVLRDVVAGSARADVFVDGATGAATLLKKAPAGAQYVVGSGRVALRTGDDIALVDLADRSVDALPDLPAATNGTRHVTDVVPDAAGAVYVASVDADRASTTGGVYGADLWRVSTGGVEHVSGFDDVYLPAIALNGGVLTGFGVSIASTDGSDAQLVTVTDPAGDATVDVADVALEVPVDTISAELAFSSAGAPLAVIDAPGGPQVRRFDGDIVTTGEAGAHFFVTPNPLRAVGQVQNPVKPSLALSGVPTTVREHGTVVRPVVKAAVSVDGVSAAAPGRLSARLRAGGAAVAIGSGSAYTLTQNVCFTAVAAGGTYLAPVAPVVRCVQVEHRLVLAGYAARTDVATVSTTASKVTVQKLVRGAWRTAFTKPVSRGRVSFTMPAAKVRVLAAATTGNAASSLLISKR